MPQHLLIYLQNQTDDPGNIEWLLMDKDGQLLQGPESNPLAQIPFASLGDHDIVVIAPSESILLSSVHVPKTNRSKMLNAIPYTLEEDLIEDIENYHFALGKPDKNNQLGVATISHAHMALWRQQLTENPLPIQQLIADVTLLPYHDNSWSLCLQADHSLLRINRYQGMAIDNDDLLSLLALQQQEQADNLPEKIHVYYTSAQQEQLTALETLGIPLEKHEYKNFLALIAPEYLKQQTINLLQQQYKPKQIQSKVNKLWWLSAGVAGIALLILLITQITQFIYWNQKDSYYENKISTTYRSIFPQSSNVIAPRERIESELKKIRSQANGNTFLLLVARAGTVIQANSRIQILDLSYRNNTLDLTVETKNFADLEKLERALEKNKLNVKQNNASSENKKVRAQYVIMEQ